MGALAQIISKGGSIYARLITGMTFKDLTGGFKCYKAETLKKVNLEKICSHGYAFQLKPTYRIYQLGGCIKEIPIVSKIVPRVYLR